MCKCFSHQKWIFIGLLLLWRILLRKRPELAWFMDVLPCLCFLTVAWKSMHTYWAQFMIFSPYLTWLCCHVFALSRSNYLQDPARSFRLWCALVWWKFQILDLLYKPLKALYKQNASLSLFPVTCTSIVFEWNLLSMSEVPWNIIIWSCHPMNLLDHHPEYNFPPMDNWLLFARLRAFYNWRH